jgi:hypothetical protein
MELSDRRWDYEVEQLIGALEEVVQPERAASPQALGRGDDPPAEVPGEAPLAARWAGRGAAAPSPSAGAQTGEPQPLPVAEPRPSRTIPTWLKVVAPLALLALVAVVAAVMLGSSGDDDAASTTSTVPPSTSVPGGASIPTVPGQTGGKAAVTVQRVERARGRTRVHLLVKNGGTTPLILPTQSFSAIDNARHSYKVDPFSKEWRGTVPAGQEVAGIIDLEESLKPGATRLKVGWSTVFGGVGMSSLFAEEFALS